jgi:hypothetical protein
VGNLEFVGISPRGQCDDSHGLGLRGSPVSRGFDPLLVVAESRIFGNGKAVSSSQPMRSPALFRFGAADFLK